MKKPLNLLAFDLGSSNGRGILGRFDGNRISLEEIHRFDNNYIEMSNMVYWDILHIYNNMKMTFSRFNKLNYGNLACFGIDAWGNDYGLLDANGQLISQARSARHTTAEDMDIAHKIVPGREIFYRTGNSSYSINTLYQLHRRLRENDPCIKSADCMMMIPDLMSFFFTGERHSEYTITTTTAMYNPTLRDWDRELLGKFGIAEHMLPPIMSSGVRCGELLPCIANETGVGRVPYALVGSHDTASAVVSIPDCAEDNNYAFCSSGTWSLLGIESEHPIFIDDMYVNNFSNEGTVQGSFRPLLNITGLWLIQEARREWNRSGKVLSWNDIVELASKAKPVRALIDPSHSDFFNVANMPLQIQKYCKRTGQYVPETIGEIARCIYESLALKYRWTIQKLRQFSGRSIDRLYIVGGGIQNKLLNQMAADCIGIPVITGPIEGACVGNLLVQAQALNELASLNEIREVVSNSFEMNIYEPHKTEQWDEAYGKFLHILKIQA